MNKAYLYILFLIIGFSCSSVTGVDDFNEMRKNADDSFLTEEQKELAKKNASILAFREQYDEDSTFIDISREKKDFYYDVLVTVLSSEAGKKYDIIQEMRIHSYISLYSLIADPLPDVSFTAAWEDSVVETNIKSIDTLLYQRGFKVESIHDWTINDGLTFVFNNETPTNTVRISQLLEETGYFRYAEVNGLIGDGSDIMVKEINSGEVKVLEVSFIYRYGDCPSGCISNDYYIFHVYQNGDVEFVKK